MPKIAYVEPKLRPSSLRVVAHANAILTEYAKQGFVITVRQLYYQFVARDLIPNNQKEYKKIVRIISDARLMGLIDWDLIVDRTRGLRSLPSWRSPQDILQDAADQFRIDKWARQPHRVEVWIEKDALVGVIERICASLQVPYFSCRGYGSQSEMWGASVRLLRHARRGQHPVVLHLGDHDPSGLDMSRDILDRMDTFGCDLTLKRIALNMDQVEEYEPPPNFAKESDSRFPEYVGRFGEDCWELDALEPSVIAELIESWTLDFRDQALWEDAVAHEEEIKRPLVAASDRWPEVVDFLTAPREDDDRDY
jgi:hypothetical protein